MTAKTFLCVKTRAARRGAHVRLRAGDVHTQCAGTHTPRVYACICVVRVRTFMFSKKGELFSCRFPGLLCLSRLSLFFFSLLLLSLSPLVTSRALSYTFFPALLSFAENRGGKNVGDFRAAFRGFSFSSRDARHEDTASLRDQVRSAGNRVDQRSRGITTKGYSKSTSRSTFDSARNFSCSFYRCEGKKND